MKRVLGCIALVLLTGVGADAATTNTTVVLNAAVGLSGTNVTATGTMTFSGFSSAGTGQFSASIPLSSLGTTGGNITTSAFPVTFGDKSTMTATLSFSAALLTASSGTTASGTVSVNGGTGTFAGASGTFTVTGSVATSGTFPAGTINLTNFTGQGALTTSGSSSGGGGGTTPTTPTITAVLDGTSNSGDLAEGGIFIVKGSNLCPSQPNGGVTLFGLPRPTVGSDGVKIAFTPTSGGSETDAILVYEYNANGVTQLSGIVPSTLAVGTYNVTVTNGTTSSPVSARVAQRKFSLFTQDTSGSGLATVQQSNYDLNRFTTGTVNGTAIAPARPGDYIIAYGTGMGPVVGADNDASAAHYDFSTNGVTVQAVIGGVTVPVAYAGLAGFPGEDQVNVQLPSNVPTGCTVPFQISVNGQLSNTTFIAIAPDAGSTACVQPGFTTAQLQSLDQGGTYNTGGFSLTDFTISVPSFGSVSEAQVGGAFTSYTGYELGAASTASITTQTIGSCTVLQNNASLSAVSTTGGTVLDAGAITLNGPSGSSLTNVSLTKTNNTYSLQIGSLPGGLGGGVNGSIVAGTYTLNGAGGADVSKFNASVSIGTPLTVTGGLPTDVTRSAGFTVNWTGGNSTDYVEIYGSSSATAGGNATSFVCTTTAGKGSFTVPSSVTSQLPASAANSGTLALVSGPAPSVSNGQFTAPLVSGGTINGAFVALVGTGAQTNFH